nr:hypothetical protein [uncultured Caldimonas sp.]
MSMGNAVPPRQVPTLTEVVRNNSDSPNLEPAPAETQNPEPPPFLLEPEGEDQIIHRVLADLQRQIDLMLEYRLRETLSPALARMADQLIRDTRVELASTLRDVVARAVAQELARLRGR